MNTSVSINTEQASNPNWQGLVPAPQTGQATLPLGATSHTVTGLNLPQLPTAVIFWVDPPLGDSTIGAEPSGTPTTDGFTVNFASALPTSSFKLVWLIFFN
jgi:hypothetical protein